MNFLLLAISAIFIICVPYIVISTIIWEKHADEKIRTIHSMAIQAILEKRAKGKELHSGPFDYLDRLEKSQVEAMKKRKPVDEVIVLWFGLDGLQLNVDGSREWISRADEKEEEKPVVPVSNVSESERYFGCSAPRYPVVDIDRWIGDVRFQITSGMVQVINPIQFGMNSIDHRGYATMDAIARSQIFETRQRIRNLEMQIAMTNVNQIQNFCGYNSCVGVYGMSNFFCGNNFKKGEV